MKATKVNKGPAESNGRLLLGIWRDSPHVTCGLTACTPGSAPGPTLGNECWKTLLFYRATAPHSRPTRHASWNRQATSRRAQCCAGQQPAGRRGSGYLGGQGGRPRGCRSRGRTAQTLNTARRNPGRLDHGCLCMPDRHSRACVVYSIRYEMLF